MKRAMVLILAFMFLFSCGCAMEEPDTGGKPQERPDETSLPVPARSDPPDEAQDGAHEEQEEGAEVTADRIWTYPVNVESPEWKDLEMSQVIEMCQMPEDLLREASDAELAGLLIDYPYILNYMAWDNWKDFFELDLKQRLNIAAELFSRDGANDALIDAYAGLEVDYEALAKGGDGLVWRHSGYDKQMFLENYFYLYMSDLTDGQMEKLVKAALDRMEKEKSAGLVNEISMSDSFNRWMRLENKMLAAQADGAPGQTETPGG